jgi:DmsE family decaheme c-type cytochrome
MLFLLMAAGAAFADDACKACHEGKEDKFVKNTHARLNTSCKACHGEGEQHQSDPSVLDMINPTDPKAAKLVNENCLSCHAANQRMALWYGSKHDKADVSCTSCHVIHTVGSEKEDMDKCLSCHKGVRRDINKMSHHPLAEGKLKCSSCHDVHGSFGRALIADDTVNDLCYQCHTEKRGPFRFAHAPVEENCLKCHSPHGTNAQRLLTQNLRTTCQGCHSFRHHADAERIEVNSRSTALMQRGSCLSCHGDIHGSNTSYHFNRSVPH